MSEQEDDPAPCDADSSIWGATTLPVECPSPQPPGPSSAAGSQQGSSQQPDAGQASADAATTPTSSPATAASASASAGAAPNGDADVVVAAVASRNRDDPDVHVNPLPHLSSLFTFVSAREENSIIYYKMKCVSCAPSVKILACNSRSYSNLKLHLERMHLGKVCIYAELAKEHKIKKDKVLTLASADETRSVKSYFGQRRKTVGTQKELDAETINFIISTGQPFNIVRQPSFINLFNTCHPGRKVMKYYSLVKKLKKEYVNMKSKLMKAFSETPYVCVTSDGWTDARRAYIGVTASYLDSTMRRHSVAIACRRLEGSHTHDVLAKKLMEVLKEYNILAKTTGVVTDNAGNFAKAFRIFGVELAHVPASAELQRDEEEEEEEEDETEEEAEAAALQLDMEELEFADLSEILEDGNVPEFVQFLPPHLRCVCHTLNLIATRDCEKIMAKDKDLKEVSRKVNAKLQGVWNKQNTSTKFADYTKEQLGKYFKTPCATR